MRTFIWIVTWTMLGTSGFSAQPSREEVIAKMKPYRGESVRGVDPSSLKGKVMCGYQGWFNAPGDKAQRGWAHYGRRGRFEPGHCSVDLWPDVSELGEDEKIATPFRHDDGSVAYVFSSHHRSTVLRHFRWMKDYGIDGVFVQRFGVETIHRKNLNHCNTVLSHCREGANRYGRTYAVMYDLSGLRSGQLAQVINDWKLLVDRMQIGRGGKDRAYLRHNGKPLIAIWGVGFKDGRKYTLAECEKLVRFFKHDPKYGGCTVMLSVPTGWRTLDRDSVADKTLHDVILQADIISPWTVGRYDSPKMVTRHAERYWTPDIKWCAERGKEYMPVVFPGFSWHNMKPESPLNQIPRLKGQFLWSQYQHAKKAGATMVYQAMFDEIDEGTAIFKCTNSPPTGASQFLNYEGLPSDHYLWLTGTGARLIRGEIESTAETPEREKLRPAVAKFRTWKSSDGKFQIEARFTKLASGRVFLERRDNGKTIQVPSTELSSEDRAHLREFLKNRRGTQQ
jgi:hypothetical protein